MISFAAELREMRGLYVSESDARLQQLQTQIDGLAETGDPASIGPLSRTFHAFTGSGRTYGFTRVTALGAEGEMLCDAVQQTGASPRDVLPCLQDLHDRIAAEFAAYRCLLAR